MAEETWPLLQIGNNITIKIESEKFNRDTDTSEYESLEIDFTVNPGMAGMLEGEEGEKLYLITRLFPHDELNAAHQIGPAMAYELSGKPNGIKRRIIFPLPKAAPLPPMMGGLEPSPPESKAQWQVDTVSSDGRTKPGDDKPTSDHPCC